MTPARWTCPACGRTFGRNLQGHFCIPTAPLSDYLAAQTPNHRAVFEAVLSVFDGLDDIIIEAANVGLFFKRPRLIAEVRPRRDWLVLLFILRRKIDDPRIQSTVKATNSATCYRVRLHTPADVDDQVREWLAEAYEDAE